MALRIPLVDLAAQEAEVAEEVLAAIAEVAREGRFVLGDRVEAFEGWLARQCAATDAVAVASGTDAIELALRGLGVGPGDAVVTTALSFVAAAEAIAQTGARPVFCDVDARTLNVTGETLREGIARTRKGGTRVRAIVPVDLFGLPVPSAEIAQVAREEDLLVIGDAAQSLGGRDEQGRPVGAVFDATCFSFFPTKNLGAWGDGGAVVTTRADLAQRLRRLRVHGATSAYVHAETGRNSRLDALQAAVLLAKTRHLERWMQARQRIAARYLAALADLPLELPWSPVAPGRHAWHAFVVRTVRRDELAAWLKDEGIETRVYYPMPLHRQPCFAGEAEAHLPEAERACRTALALPMFPALQGERQERVIEATRRFFGT